MAMKIRVIILLSLSLAVNSLSMQISKGGLVGTIAPIAVQQSGATNNSIGANPPIIIAPISTKLQPSTPTIGQVPVVQPIPITQSEPASPSSTNLTSTSYTNLTFQPIISTQASLKATPISNPQQSQINTQADNSHPIPSFQPIPVSTTNSISQNQNIQTGPKEPNTSSLTNSSADSSSKTTSIYPPIFSSKVSSLIVDSNTSKTTKVSLQNSSAPLISGVNEIRVLPLTANKIQMDSGVRLNTSDQQSVIKPGLDAGLICCLKSYIFDVKTLSCICPPAQPFINLAGYCVACNSPSIWDPMTKTCVNCPPGSTYDQISHSCLCNALTPFQQKDGSCVACTSPNFWNCDTLTCESCPPSMTYDTSKGLCTCPLSLPHLTFDNICIACKSGQDWDYLNAQCITCSVDKTFDQTSGKCICPTDQPFQDHLNNCVSCKAPKYWSLIELKCFDCPCNTQYDTVLQICVICPDQMIFDSATHKCSCPLNAPYLSSVGTCVACAVPTPFWNKTSLECEACQNDLIFNENSSNCECSNQKKQALSGSDCKACPDLAPIWDGKLCQKCPTGAEYSIVDKKCVICPQGLKFNTLLNKCQK